ncbi:hypothetical protein SprV_0200765500 [Sparganum proliferum]
MQEAWTVRKTEEIQGYTNRNEWKNFSTMIKPVHGLPTKATAPLFSADGSTVLTEKTQILQQMTEHFRGVLNRPSTTSDTAIARMPQVETNADLGLPPSLHETIRSVQQLSSGKAPGSDAIPTEIYKHGGPQLIDHLRTLFRRSSPSYLEEDLATCSHVYLRCDRVHRPLEPPYDGPFRVLSRGTKTFRIQRDNREEVVSVDRFKAVAPDTPPDEPCGTLPFAPTPQDSIPPSRILPLPPSPVRYLQLPPLTPTLSPQDSGIGSRFLCARNTSIQAERKPPALRQSPRHLTAQHRRGNLRSHPSQLPEPPSGTRSPAGKQVRLPPSSWDHGHDLRRPATAGELSGDETHLYSNFVDLTKAFDTVHRQELWKIAQKFSCPERFSEMVRQLQDCMIARVTDNGAVSEAFAVTKGVKQGCVLAPALLSLMFSVMLMDAYRDERPGIRIAYRTDGKLLKHRRVHFQSRVFTTTVHELLFADDSTLNITSERGMQIRMNLFAAAAAACDNFGLIINTEKTVVMHQPPPDIAYVASNILVNGAQLQVVDSFTYLGSTLSCNTIVDDEVAHRIYQANQAHAAEDVQGRRPTDVGVWSRDLDGVHEAGTYTQSLPPQLSSSDTEAEVAGLDPDTEVLERTGILSKYAMLRQLQLPWSGHLVWMDEERLPKRILFGDVATGSCRQGGQIRRYKDTLKTSLKRLQINPTNWKDLARD